MAFDPRVLIPGAGPFFLGGGGGGGKGKEARRQEDIARQREEIATILNNFAAQLTPGSAEFNQLMSVGQQLLDRSAEGPFAVEALGGAVLDQQQAATQLGQQLVTQQQQRIAEGGPATALEARTQRAFEGLRGVSEFTPEEQEILNALRGIDPNSELGQVVNQIVERAGRPVESFETFTSTLPQQLALAQQQVAQGFARRGLSLSGLEVEGSQRVSNELAVREAQARQQARVQAQQERRSSLQDLERLFGVGQRLRGREIGVEAALTELQAGRESGLTELLGQQTAIGGEAQRGLLGRQTGRAEGLTDIQRATDEQRRQELINLGMSVAQLPFLSSGLPAGAAGTFTGLAGGPSTPITVAELQAFNQAGLGGLTQTGGRRSLSDLLSRAGS